MQFHVLPAPGRDNTWLWIVTPATGADATPVLEGAIPGRDELARISNALGA
jgi:hypothetical protein